MSKRVIIVIVIIIIIPGPRMEVCVHCSVFSLSDRVRARDQGSK